MWEKFLYVCQYFLAPILIAKGQMQHGIRLLDKAQKVLIENQRKSNYALSEYIFGEVNSQIATGNETFPIDHGQEHRLFG